MSHQSRFQFPGFALTGIKDTDTHEVEVGTIESGGKSFSVEVLRTKKFEAVDFLIRSVSVDGRKAWSFKNTGWNGLGFLADTTIGPVIALCGYGLSGKVMFVTPLSVLAGTRADLRSMIQAKRDAASFLGRDFEFTQSERTLDRADRERARKQEDETRAAAQAAREVARTERIQRMLSRGVMHVFTTDGRTRRGIPVTKDEWPSVTPGTYVVLVDSFDEAAKTPGNPIESFQVKKERGKHPEKAFALPVTAEKPKTEAPTSPTAMRKELVVEKDGDAFAALVFPDMDAIREARANGLNGGTPVTTGQVLPDNKVMVYAVHHDVIETLGHYTVIN